jgi:mRNA interferase MazF
MKKGDIVICALTGDFGKPRPAVVVQSDLVNATHATALLCPITSYLIDAPLFRIPLHPTDTNGLSCKSQIMVDKLSVMKIEKISKKIGKLHKEERHKLDEALKFWLDLI